MAMAAAGEERVRVQEEMEMEMEMERIFVGGLGLGVTEDDLERLFITGVGGKVDGVHIIRTKGRSFAYVDFLPSSQKSLSKLFATYNGCVWKGGKLKLHKAKEHYLIRMKREWDQQQQEQEQALLAASVPESAATTQQAKISSNKQLRLFFPALRTVKSLPYSGTGKHKYSFQRVQAPAFPLHFCDCEEHSVSFDLSHHHQPSDHVVIDEKELGMMNKVMAKFLEKETPQDKEDIISHHADTPAASQPSRQHDDDDDDDHLLANEAEDADVEEHQEEEDDDFIINIVSNNQEKKMVSPLQVLRSNGIEAHTILNGPSNKKKKSLPDGNYNATELEVPAIPDRKTTIKSRSNESRKLSGAQPEMHVQQSTAPVSWSQKSSWKQLIGGHKDNGGFSVSHILTGGASSSTDNMGLNRGSLDVNHCDTRKQELASNGNLEGKLNEMEPLKAIAKHKPSKSSEESNISGREQAQESSGTQLNEDNGGNTTEQPQTNISGVDGKNKNLSSDGNMDGEICEMEMMEENAKIQPLQEPSNITKSGRGPYWRQKMSWTQLINNTGSSFSITQILPGGISSKQQQSVPKPTGVDVVSSSSGSKLEETVKEDRNNNLIRRETSSLGIAAEGNGKQRSNTFKENQQIIASSDSACAQHLTPKQAASTGTADKGETCLFVRSDATVKEWRKAKAALSKPPRKRKNIDN